MEADGSEISRLPEELLASILSLTSPPDAGRCAAVFRAFLAAADSDAVWSCFLPRDLPRFAQGVLRRPPPSNKGLFRRLSDQPALLPGNLVSMRLNKNTGATIDYWEWIKLPSHQIQANKRKKECKKCLRRFPGGFLKWPMKSSGGCTVGTHLVIEYALSLKSR